MLKIRIFNPKPFISNDSFVTTRVYLNLIRLEDMMARQMHLVEWWLVSAMDMAGTVSSTMDKIWQDIR